MAGEGGTTDLGWCLTAKEPDMVYTYRWGEITRVTVASRWTIEDFKTKMETFKQGQQLESSQFVIGGLKLCINLYPNGRSVRDLFLTLQSICFERICLGMRRRVDSSHCS